MDSNNCNLCAGTGIYTTDDGSVNCPKCMARKFMNGSGVPKSFHSIKLDDLDPDWGNSTQDMIRCARNVINQKQAWFTVLGRPGNGKTTMLYSVVNYFNRLGQKQFKAKYWTMPEIMLELQGVFNTPGANINDTLNKILSARIIAFDEVDKVNLTEWSLSIMTQIIDRRWRAAGDSNQITLWAMNNEPNSDWIRSRLFDTRWETVEINSPDVRLAMPSINANDFSIDSLS